MTTLFTVIISTHGRPLMLKRAIRSLIQQTFQNFSVIIISDLLDTPPPSEELSALPHPPLFIIRGGLHGPAESRNVGLELAKSDYIVFLDDDDTFEPTHLQAMAALVASVRPDIAYCNFNLVNETRHGDTIITVSKTPKIIGVVHQEDIFVKNTIPNNCLIYRRDIVNKSRYDASLVLLEDWAFLLGCLPVNNLHYINLWTANVHKTDHPVTQRRGSANERHRLDVYLDIYKKHPAPGVTINQARKQFFDSIGIEYPY